MQLTQSRRNQSPFVGIRTDTGFAVVRTDHYLAAQESIRDLGGPACTVIENGYLIITGPRSRYKLQNCFHADWAIGNRLDWEAYSAILRWAKEKRAQIKSKKDPNFQAVQRATKKVRDRAAFWAIDRGFRGVGDAASKLSKRVSQARQFYHAAFDSYREERLQKPCLELQTSEGFFEHSSTDWLRARRIAQQAGHWLAMELSRKNVRQNRGVLVTANWTERRHGLAQILGVELPPYSQLNKDMKTRTATLIARKYIDRNTQARHLFRPALDWGGDTISHILAFRKLWIAASDLQEEFQRILQTGELPEMNIVGEDESGNLVAGD